MKDCACLLPGLIALVASALNATIDTASAQEADPAATAIIESLSLRESEDPVRDHPRWAKPRKVAVVYRGSSAADEAEFLDSIRSVAGNAEIVLMNRSDPDVESIADADVFLGYCAPRLIKQLKYLRWIHSYSVGVDHCLRDSAVRQLDFIMTNNQRLSAPSIAEVAIGLTLVLTKNLHQYQKAQYQQQWARNDTQLTTDLAGRTMLVLGLGGIGTETARRASGLGMRIIATRNSGREGPEFVDKVGLSHEMYEFATEADVVVNALPLTAETDGLINRHFFDAVKPGAYYINVGRGKTTVTKDLITALKEGTLAGAGLDVTDPEPLPPGHPLWRTENVVITPHIAGRNSDAYQRALIIARENLRRYVKGDRLLSVVNVERGY